jgi:hypothetical protein
MVLQLVAEGGELREYVFHAMKSPILYGHAVADTMSDIITLTNVVIRQIVAMADGIVNPCLEEHHKNGIQVWEALTYID